MNICLSKLNLNPYFAYIHGANMVLIDGLGIGSGLSNYSIKMLREECYSKLLGFFKT